MRSSCALRRSDVDAPLESPAEELTRLRDCLNDLCRIMALPASGEPSRIVETLLDALAGALRFSFTFVRLNHLEGQPEGAPPIEMTRVAGPLEESTCAREI